MSVINPYPPAGPVSQTKVPEQGDPPAVEHLIAHVLRCAHRTAETHDDPDEARAIFHVALAFASELETTSPEFDRLRFIKAATGR